VSVPDDTDSGALGGDAPRGASRRLYVLTLSTGTMMLVLAMPSMAMPVLFPQIAAELGLSLVQIGVVWGIAPLAGVVFGLLGGMAADVRGTRKVIAVACIVCGVVGAARGLAGGFATLAITTLLLGMAGSAIPNNLHKTAGHWFSPRSLGKANSVLSLGAAAGAMLGALVSAAVLSPLLGGWRHVLFFYGVVAIVFGVVWLFGPDEPRHEGSSRGSWNLADFRRTLGGVVPVRAFWLLVVMSLCYSAYQMGFSGYLPLYLSEHGWSTAASSIVLAAFSAASMVGVIPLTLLAERYHLRRAFLAVAGSVAVVGLIVISLTTSPWVWPVVVAMGLFHDVFMTITITMIVQTAGIGPALAGTALGIMMSLSRVGGFVSPPLGNSLAALGAGLPFLFWAGFAVAMLAVLTRVRAARPEPDTGSGTLLSEPGL
jgi:MFS family permease